MYGRSDSFGSPMNVDDEEFGGDLSDIDDELADDDEEFGALLGIGKGGAIAIGKNAQKKKISRILGKLKKFFEEDNLEKAARYAKSLSEVNLIQKKGYTTPEIAAWVDFASSDDEDALREALEAINWAGNESDESDDDDDAEVEGEVYTSDGGAGRPHRGRGRKLPPGFRPRGYSSWAPRRKARWLAKHARAASVRLPVDPGPMPGRGGYRVRPVRPSRVGHLVRPVRPGRGGDRGLPGRPDRGLPGRPAPSPFSAAIRPTLTSAAIRPTLMSAASPRFRGIEDAIKEGFEEFGSALIGASAFRNLQGRDALSHSELFLDGLDDDLDDEDDDEDGDDEFGAYIAEFGEDDDEDGDDEFGAYIAEFGEDDDEFGDDGDDEFGAHIPQFGAVFRRDIDERLELARRRYERLRGKETDLAKVQEAYQDYQRLVKALKQASELPTAQRAGPSLAGAWGRQRPIGEDADYAPPENRVFRLGGRVAADDDDEDDFDLDLEAAV